VPGACAELRVERIGPQDWALLRDLRLAALREAPHAFGSTFRAECAQGPQSWRCRAARLAWFVARPEGQAGQSGRAAGIVAGEVDGEDRWVLSMWVHPGWRGRGVAAALLTALRGWAVGASTLRLWVADGNDAAMRAYRRFGFVPSGHRGRLPSNPAVGEEMWVLDLHL